MIFDLLYVPHSSALNQIKPDFQNPRPKFLELWSRFLQAECPFCLPYNSIIVLKKARGIWSVHI